MSGDTTAQAGIIAVRDSTVEDPRARPALRSRSHRSRRHPVTSNNGSTFDVDHSVDLGAAPGARDHTATRWRVVNRLLDKRLESCRQNGDGCGGLASSWLLADSSRCIQRPSLGADAHLVAHRGTCSSVEPAHSYRRDWRATRHAGGRDTRLHQLDGDGGARRRPSTIGSGCVSNAPGRRASCRWRAPSQPVDAIPGPLRLTGAGRSGPVIADLLDT